MSLSAALWKASTRIEQISLASSGIFLFMAWYSYYRSLTLKLVIEDWHHQILSTALNAVLKGVIAANGVVAEDLGGAIWGQADQEVESVVREEPLAVEGLH